jgi:hypothetical protein
LLVDGGIVRSVASLIDLRYVTLITKGAPKDDLDRLRPGLLAAELVELPPIRGAAYCWERL